MLLSPKLLNLHKDAHWQQEYGLTPLSLRELILPLCTNLSEILQTQGVHCCLFEDKQEIRFNFGEGIDDPALFDNLKQIISLQHEFIHFSNNDKNPQLAHLTDALREHELTDCLLINIRLETQALVGYCCFYGNRTNLNQTVLSPIVKLFNTSLASTLSLQKYKRLTRDQDEFHQLVIDTNTHPVFAKDLESRLVLANKAFVSLYPAHAQDKIIGYTTVEEYDEQQQTLFIADDKEAFERGEKIAIETIDFPNGEQRTLKTIKRHFKTSTGNDYILGLSYDLTNEYHLINLLKKKNQDLDHVANLLATDVRAPANAMVQLIKWLEQDLADSDNPDITENLREIRKRSIKVSKLMTAIYRYCFAGRDTYIATSISLTSLVADVLSNINTSKKIETNIDDATVMLPQMPIFTIFEVLLRNAVEHHANDKVRIEVDCSEDKKNYYLSIKDNGTGIVKDRHESVFTLFESSKIVPDEDVVGIGLAIARKIIESYAGRMYIDTQTTSGTKVNMTWPKQHKR